MFEDIIRSIQALYPDENPVPLHAPRFLGNEKKYLSECIDTTYVSYVGSFVTDFEEHIKKLTGAKHAIAMVNGTAALHMTLLATGVMAGDEVITQALTFAATAHAIRHAGAEPVFVDVDAETMGMSAESLRAFFKAHTEVKNDACYNRATQRRIAACVPMHTFGFPVHIDAIVEVCNEFCVQVIEDAAESLGSRYKGTHTGMFGRAAIFSFNGNKPVTTGGGGMVITNDDALAQRVRHISTTAKRPHQWEFFHDMVGYNNRMPNINAAVGCAQMEKLEELLQNKRETAQYYQSTLPHYGVKVFAEPANSFSNYWLNVVLCADRAERDAFLATTNTAGVQTRPIWTLMTKLPAFALCKHMPLDISQWFEDRVVNIPSSVRRVPLP